jgi:hypothetical protein
MVGVSAINEADNILYLLASTSSSSPSSSLFLVTVDLTQSSYTTLAISTSISFIGMHWYADDHELYVLRTDGVRTLNTVTGAFGNLIGTYASGYVGVQMCSSSLQRLGLVSIISKL